MASGHRDGGGIPWKRPFALVVSGYPATGKTTLAQLLGRELAVPVISKDAIKEQLFDTLGAPNVDDSRRLGVAAIALMFSLADSILKQGLPVILELPALPIYDNSRVARLESECGCRAIQIVLTAKSSVIEERYRHRASAGARHPSHFDRERLAEIAEMVRRPFAPLDVSGPTLKVDTSNWSDFDQRAVLAWAARTIGLEDRDGPERSCARQSAGVAPR